MLSVDITSSAGGTVFDAIFWSSVAMVPVLISAWFGLALLPSRRVIVVAGVYELFLNAIAKLSVSHW